MSSRKILFTRVTTRSS